VRSPLLQLTHQPIRFLLRQEAHAPFGPLTALTYSSGERRAVSRDLDYRPKAIVSGSVMSHVYSYDANGNVTAISDGAQGKNRYLSVDMLDRLSQEIGPYGTVSFSYDPNGDRLAKTENGLVRNYSYQLGRNRLAAVSGATRSYDASGNTTRIGSQYFDYSKANRLWRFRQGSTTVTYQYNGFGERALKSAGSSKRWFIYDGPNLLHEQTNGQDSGDYIYLNGVVVGLVRNGQLYYVRPDHLGRPEVVTTAWRYKVWQADNAAFDRRIVLGGMAADDRSLFFRHRRVR